MPTWDDTHQATLDAPTFQEEMRCNADEEMQLVMRRNVSGRP
jgi:hypothetical protein